MTTAMQKSTQQQLRQIVESIERLDEDRKGIAADISEKFKDAKNQGFDVKVLRQIIKLRKMSASERRDAEEILAVYASALWRSRNIYVSRMEQ